MTLAELRFRHAREGNTNPLTVQLTANASHGAIGGDGISPATGFPTGIIDMQGWLKRSDGTTYLINPATVSGITYQLTVLSGTAVISGVTFTPRTTSPGVIDVNALLAGSAAQFSTPAQLDQLNAGLLAIQGFALDGTLSTAISEMPTAIARVNAVEQTLGTLQTAEQILSGAQGAAGTATAASAASEAARVAAVAAQGVAEGKAGEALTQAQKALEYKTDAESAKNSALGSASSAAQSASAAQSSASDADLNAAAAVNSRTRAETAAGAASTSAGVAQGAAAAASQSADGASQSATAAQTSATAASTKAGEAAGSANAAAESATTAGAARTAAGEYAQAALTQKIAAETAAANAAGSAAAAANSETTVSGYRTDAQNAAAVSQTNALTAKSSYEATVQRDQNWDFALGNVGWTLTHAGTTALPDILGRLPNSLILTDATARGGKVASVTGNVVLEREGVYPVDTARKYKVSARVKREASGAPGQALYLMLVCYDASGNEIPPSSPGGTWVYPAVVMLESPSAWTVLEHVVTGEADMTTGDNISYFRPGTKYVRVGVLTSAQVTTPAPVTLVDYIMIEDVTESTRAANHAAAAATSATTAQTSATEAGNSAGAAHQSYLDANSAYTQANTKAGEAAGSAGAAAGSAAAAAGSASSANTRASNAEQAASAAAQSALSTRAERHANIGYNNPSFDLDGLGWSIYPEGPELVTDNNKYVFVTGQNAEGKALFLWGSTSVYGKTPVPLTPGKKLKLSVKATAGAGLQGGDTATYCYAGFACKQPNGEYYNLYNPWISHAMNGGDGWHTASVTLSTEQIRATFPATIAVVPLFLANFLNGNADQTTGLTALDTLSFEDVTATDAAAAAVVKASEAGASASLAGDRAYAADQSRIAAQAAQGLAAGSANAAQGSAVNAGTSEANARSYMVAAASTQAFRVHQKVKGADITAGYGTTRLNATGFRTQATPSPINDQANIYISLTDQTKALTTMQARVRLHGDTNVILTGLMFGATGGYVYSDPILPGGINSAGILPRGEWITVTWDFMRPGAVPLSGFQVGVTPVSGLRLSVVGFNGAATGDYEVEWVAGGFSDVEQFASQASLDTVATNLSAEVTARTTFQRTPSSQRTLQQKLLILPVQAPYVSNIGVNNLEFTNAGWAACFKTVGPVTDPFFWIQGLNIHPTDLGVIRLRLHWNGPQFTSRMSMYYSNPVHGWDGNYYIDAVNPDGSTEMVIPSNQWFELEFRRDRGAYENGPNGLMSNYVTGLRFDIQADPSNIPVGYSFYLDQIATFSLDSPAPPATAAELKLLSDEYKAEATIKVQSGNVIAGIGARAATGQGSEVVVLADRFAVTSVAGGVTKHPFIVTANGVEVDGDLVASGTITAKAFKVGALNLINNPTQTNSAEGWTGDGMSLVSSNAHGAYSSGLAIEATTTGAATHSITRIDPSKTYAFNASVYCSHAGVAGSDRYFGFFVYRIDGSGSPLRVYDAHTRAYLGDSHWMRDNPYFWYAPMSAQESRMMRGLLVPWGTDIATLPSTGLNVHYIYMMGPDVAYTTMRMLNYNNQGTYSRQFWYNLSIQEYGSGTQIDEFGIKTNAIEARHIKANSISADKFTAQYLQVGTTLNDLGGNLDKSRVNGDFSDRITTIDGGVIKTGSIQATNGNASINLIDGSMRFGPASNPDMTYDGTNGLTLKKYPRMILIKYLFPTAYFGSNYSAGQKISKELFTPYLNLQELLGVSVPQGRSYMLYVRTDGLQIDGCTLSTWQTAFVNSSGYMQMERYDQGATLPTEIKLRVSLSLYVMENVYSTSALTATCFLEVWDVPFVNNQPIFKPQV